MAKNVPASSGAKIIDVMLLRKAIGVLGVALPFLLMIGGWLAGVALRPSMSAYYRTQMHDVFVGVLCALGLGLFAYEGYLTTSRDLTKPRERALENWVANVAAGCAVGTALFAPGKGEGFWKIPPPPPENPLLPEIVPLLPLLNFVCNNVLHHVCAILFIAILAWFAWQFSKGRRCCFYRVCAAVTVVGAVVAGLHAVKIVNFIPNGVFWGESVAVWGFGAAWFRKGSN